MSVRDYLTAGQIDKIQSVIREQCVRAARNDDVERNRIGSDLYYRLKKGRKAHDVTGDIYVALFYPENTIDGLHTGEVSNGIYTQPELENDLVVIHIYHQTNRLNSRLVKERKNGNKQFFCIRYDHDKAYHLKSIESVHPATGEVEKLYTAPKLLKVVG